MSAEMSLRLVAVVAGAVVLLTACSHTDIQGGTSGGDVGSVTPPAVLANDAQPTLANSLATSFPLAGHTVSFAAAGGATTVAERGGVLSSRTRDSATRATLRFSIDGVQRNAIIDLTQPSVTPSGLGVPVFQVSLASGGTLTTADSNAATLSYASFGYWAFQPADFPIVAGTLMAYFNGRETPLTAVPRTGSAIYSGATLGYGAVSGVDFFLTGNVLLNASFTPAGGTIGGQVNTIATVPVSSPLPAGAALPTRIDFTGGTISNNTFTGTTTAVSGAASIVGSGTFAGKFFGPLAEEAAGQWRIESAPDPAATLRVIGGFGARR